MFKILSVIVLASVTSVFGWCHRPKMVYICHQTESGYVTLHYPTDTKFEPNDFPYAGPTDKHGKPSEAATEWCSEHVPTPPEETPPVVTPPADPTPPVVQTPQPAPTRLPNTGPQ